VVTAHYSEFSNTVSCVQAILVKRRTKTTKQMVQQVLALTVFLFSV